MASNYSKQDSRKWKDHKNVMIYGIIILTIAFMVQFVIDIKTGKFDYMAFSYTFGVFALFVGIKSGSYYAANVYQKKVQS